MISALLDDAAKSKYRHRDEWLSGIASLTRDEQYQESIEEWCEENLLFWNDEEFNA